MKLFRLALGTLVTLSLAGPAAADESGCFVVRLGSDTTGVERYTRTDARTEVFQAGRAPRTLQRHFVYDFARGDVITRMTMVVTPPGSTTPTQSIEATFGPDSMRMKIQSGSAPLQNVAVAMPPGTVVVASSSPWANYERAIAKLVRGKSDSLRTTMYFLGAGNTDWLSLRKLGRDSVVVFNGHQDLYHVRVDRAGRVLGVLPVAGTGKFSVDRVASVDVDAMAAGWAAREQAGAGLGTLSPRDSVVVNAGGASLWVDYGRPGKRGREIFGNVVPWGEVWRTGANAATQFRTDKALNFGDTVVPPGFYTLWTIPAPGGWKLIVNGETGQWGTAHKPEKDLYALEMKTGALPETVERFTISVEPNAGGGVLNFDWDRTRASAAFTVAP